MTKLYEELEQLQGKYLEALRTAANLLATVEVETQVLLRDPSNAEELKQVGIISNQASIKGAKISVTASMRIEDGGLGYVTAPVLVAMLKSLEVPPITAKHIKTVLENVLRKWKYESEKGALDELIRRLQASPEGLQAMQSALLALLGGSAAGPKGYDFNGHVERVKDAVIREDKLGFFELKVPGNCGHLTVSLKQFLEQVQLSL